MKRQFLTFALLAAAAFGMQAEAQITTPAASPKQTLTQQFATSKIEIVYSRPSVKGRKIFGDLVPYGKLWRTGANASTQLFFGEEVKINGMTVPAGRYSFFTVPGEKEWELIINKDSALGGTAGYTTDKDVIRFKVKPEALKSNIETFTIEIANMTNNTAEIQLKWEKTGISFKVETNYDAKVMAQIDKAMNVDSRPYYQAASYYYDNNKDNNKALEWVTKAAEMNPDAYWVQHLKAKIELRAGKKEDAIKSAEKSKAKALEAKNDEFVKMNDALIAEAKKK